MVSATNNSEVSEDEGNDSANVDSNVGDNETITPIPPIAASRRPPPALQGAGCLSRWTFSWAADLLRRGMASPLQDTDLPGLLEEDTSAFNRTYMERLWENEQRRAANEVKQRMRRRYHCCSKFRGLFHPTKPSLYHALMKDYFTQTWYAQLLLATSMAARLGQSLALGLLIEQFTPTDEKHVSSTKMGYAWASTLVGCGVIFLLTKQL